MSKYQFHESDIYIPGTEIPVNRLGITDGEQLAGIEAELLEQAYQQFIEELTPQTRFDESYFRSLHQRTFESIYDWAGEYRQQDMRKGHTLFCRAVYLQAESHRIFAALEGENFLRDGHAWPLAQFAERLAFHQGELIALHPFLELNGRITRLFFDLIAIRNGYNPIDYSVALTDDPEVGNNYIRASIDCVQQADHSRLQAIILQGLTRAEQAP